MYGKEMEGERRASPPLPFPFHTLCNLPFTRGGKKGEGGGREGKRGREKESTEQGGLGREGMRCDLEGSERERTEYGT